MLQSTAGPFELPSRMELQAPFLLSGRVFARSRKDSLSRAWGHRVGLCDFASATSYLVSKHCRVPGPAPSTFARRRGSRWSHGPGVNDGNRNMRKAPRVAGCQLAW
jgi:hypothetical protein